MWRDVFLNNREAVLEMLQPLQGGPVRPAARHPLGRGRQAVRPVHAHPRDPPRADPSQPGVSRQGPYAPWWVFAYGSLMWNPGFATPKRAGSAARLAPRLLHLLGPLSRHAAEAGPDPRPAAGRFLPRPGPSPAAAKLRRRAPLPVGSRDRQRRRLSRRRPADPSRRWPRRAGAGLSRRSPASPVRRQAAARQGRGAGPPWTRRDRQQPRLCSEHRGALAELGPARPRSRSWRAAQDSVAAKSSGVR